MNRALPFILYASLGLLLGWATGTVGKGPAPVQVPAVPARAREDPAPRPLWRGEDFHNAALRQSVNVMDPTFTPLKSLLGDWTDEEIRSALDEAVRDPESLIRSGGMAGMLLREYMRRDHGGAVEWFLAQPAIHQTNLASTLSHVWPQEHALEGLQLIRTHKDLFLASSTGPWSIIVKSLATTSAGGPAAVTALLAELKAEGFSLAFENPIPFPPGFDFAGLLGSEKFRELGVAEMKRSTIAMWRQQDRDGAFTWILANEGVPELQALTRFAPDMPADSTKWFVGKLNELDPDQRRELLDLKGMEWSSFDGNIKGWIDAAPSPELAREIRVSGAQSLFAGAFSKALPAIETLKEGEERLAFLETLPRSPAIKSPPGPVDPAGEKFLRKKLAEWGADEARAESIVNRFKPLPNP